MSTRLLAQQLDLIETIPVNKPLMEGQCVQTFDYLIFLDFEATCWDRYDLTRGSAEIIEFPAVFYDLRQHEILKEFQEYVMPTERPILSITQKQVDKGVPLQTSLLLFTRWLQELTNIYNLTFDSTDMRKKRCAFVTWSDWDLGTCLEKECRRKQIRKSEIFNKWINLRALYEEYYNRRPLGLSGALFDVGLTFEGKEHCGLDDAKNTAFLAKKMVSDGVLLRITKELD
ncbi:5' exonuclease eri1-related [Holotrichia oblita]|uniref:5' exonuclease eri1-related n=2 Tax=Holotrichia oblita TaxID=644536 RepID=A0ACB9SSQ9_HOLOL|nr:5' exonuclease eri1-related [Holotrichia oblita]KAI4458231.1 5' exonuclease eri1-related [Holotrichia oblita]